VRSNLFLWIQKWIKAAEIVEMLQLLGRMPLFKSGFATKPRIIEDVEFANVSEPLDVL
jgi:hypothetical protein